MRNRELSEDHLLPKQGEILTEPLRGTPRIAVDESDEPNRPERDLLASMILQARADIRAYTNKKEKGRYEVRRRGGETLKKFKKRKSVMQTRKDEDHRNYMSALRWIKSNGHFPVSFAYCCAFLGLPVAETRAAVLAGPVKRTRNPKRLSGRRGK